MSAAKPSRIAEYLDHMLEAIALARKYVAGMERTDFLADRRTQQAVVMNILVIGEAASRLAERHPEFVRAHPRIPWASMRGMRNRLAHGYFEIDLDTVWHTLQHDLPALSDDLKAIRHTCDSAD
ncbi:MAG: DUF86 domain-containing protein [Proteobacteria bacterium]|nr:DUF86 domain-containing protein [Pseudomonadota bacterium]